MVNFFFLTILKQRFLVVIVYFWFKSQVTTTDTGQETEKLLEQVIAPPLQKGSSVRTKRYPYPLKNGNSWDIKTIL